MIEVETTNTTSTHLVGISGKMQVGKDTGCTIIQAIDVYNNLNRQDDFIPFIKECITTDKLYKLLCFRDVSTIWEKHSYADKLKQIASKLTNVPVFKWESADFKDSYSKMFPTITNREVLQIIGDDFREKFGKDVWIKALFEDYSPQFDSWIIPDVRMPDEVKAIRDRNGIIIRINRKTIYNNNHISETALDNYTDYDYIIDNNGSLEDLIEQVNYIYQQLWYKKPQYM